jgi:hypothetical protein
LVSNIPLITKLHQFLIVPVLTLGSPVCTITSEGVP